MDRIINNDVKKFFFKKVLKYKINDEYFQSIGNALMLREH